jgi:hypothetical protein
MSHKEIRRQHSLRRCRTFRRMLFLKRFFWAMIVLMVLVPLVADLLVQYAGLPPVSESMRDNLTWYWITAFMSAVVSAIYWLKYNGDHDGSVCHCDDLAGFQHQLDNLQSRVETLEFGAKLSLR